MNNIMKNLTFIFFLLFIAKLSFGYNFKDSLYKKINNSLSEAVAFNQKMDKEGTPEKRNFLINVEYQDNNNTPNTFRQIIGKDKADKNSGFTFPDADITELKNRVLKINQENPEYNTFLIFINYIPYDYYNDYQKEYKPHVEKFYNSNISSSWGDNKANYEYYSWEEQREEHAKANLKSSKIKASEFRNILDFNTNGKKIRAMFLFEFVGFRMGYSAEKLNKNNAIDYNVDINNEISYGNYTRTVTNTCQFLDQEMQDFMGVQSSITYPAIPTSGVKSFREIALYDLENGVSQLETITAALKVKVELQQNLDTYINSAITVINDVHSLPDLSLPSSAPNELLEKANKILKIFNLLSIVDEYTLTNSINFTQRIKLLKILSAYTTDGLALQRIQVKYQPLIVKLFRTVPNADREAFMSVLTSKTNPSYYNELCYKYKVGNTFNGSLLYTLYDNVTDNEGAEFSYTHFFLQFKRLSKSPQLSYFETLLAQMQSLSINEEQFKKDNYIWQREKITSQGSYQVCEDVVGGNHYKTRVCRTVNIPPPAGITKIKAKLNIDGSVTVTKMETNGKGGFLTSEIPYPDASKFIYFMVTDNVSLLTPVLKSQYNKFIDKKEEQRTLDSMASVPALALVYANDKQNRQNENEDFVESMQVITYTLNGLAVVLPVLRIGSFATMTVSQQMAFIFVDAGMAFTSAFNIGNQISSGQWATQYPNLNSFFTLYTHFVGLYCVGHLGKLGIDKVKGYTTKQVTDDINALAKARVQMNEIMTNGGALPNEVKSALKIIDDRIIKMLNEAEDIVGIKQFWNQADFMTNEFGSITNTDIKNLANFLRAKRKEPFGPNTFTYADDVDCISIDPGKPVELNFLTFQPINNVVDDAYVLTKPKYKVGSNATAITNQDVLVAIQKNGKIKTFAADTIVLSTVKLAIVLGQKFTPLLNSKLNDLYVQLTNVQKVPQADAIKYIENLSNINTTAESNLINFISKLSDKVGSKELRRELASYAGNYPGLTQELAENNLFNKYIEVLQTPNKAEAEVAKALQTGLKSNAASYYQFLKNVAANNFINKIDEVLVSNKFTELLTKLKAITGGSAQAIAARSVRYASKLAFRDQFVKLYNEVAYKGVLKQQALVTEDFKFLLENHTNAGNIELFVDEMMQMGTKFQGASHQLDLLKNRPTHLQGKTLTKFEGDIFEETSNCKFDMLFGAVPNEVLVEAKNFAAEGIAFINKPSKFNQLKAYFSRVSSMDNFHYYFRANSGVTLDNIKTEFQNMLKDPTLTNGLTRADELFNVMNIDLKTNILGSGNAQRKDLFLGQINDINSMLFKFIKLF